jgi:hypothetical protein
MTMQYVSMLLLGAFAGLLSGFLWFVPNGLMGGALGMSLAAGAIWLGRRRQKQGGGPTPLQIIQAGLVSGLLAGVLMAGISQACVGARRGDFGPPVLPFWYPLVMGVLYGLVVQWGYSVRRGFFNPHTSAFVATCFGCFVLKTLATFSYRMVFEKTSGPSGVLSDSIWESLLGAVPFALFWFLGMAFSDPSWPPPPARAPVPRRES